ncbi:Palladin [Chelonia mydas]|uniref:Palladin n=1 Tax=Chelonia mydas TaxID=8469 RepID=M7BL56_CHEMY|nr:Palladin [Chelonia mydas]
MNSQEEEEDGGHVSGGCSYAVSQDLFEIPPQFSQSRQLSTGKSVERGGTSGIQDGEVSNELSAFLSKEEISKSLDLAREAIANSVKENQNVEQEFTHHFNTSPNSSEYASSRKAKDHEQDVLGRLQVSSPNSLFSTAQTLPEQQKQQPPMSPQAASSICTVPGRQGSISPSLTASPSFIRSLRNAERCSPNTQKTSPKSKSMSQGDAPFRNKLCDKAAMFIEELSSIFREAAKARGRSPSGDSSSPDSGYLSPKKKQSAMINASVNQSPVKAYPETKPEAKLPETHHNGEPFPDRQNVIQESGTAFHHELTNPSSYPSSAPRFTQKLRSQEVAEGSKVLLECRVAGNPTPHVRGVRQSQKAASRPVDSINPRKSLLEGKR